MSQKIAVLITGVGGGGFGHELVKSLKLEDQYYIIGVDMADSSFGLFDVDEAYTVPSATDPTYLDTLLDICGKHRIQVFIPGSEPELKVISKNRDQIKSAGILPLINTENVIEMGMDKTATMRLLKNNGFTIPKSTTVKAVLDIPSEFPLPAVVKPSIGGGGSNNTFIVQDQNELDFACRYLVSQERVVMLQEYVGTPEDEFTVGVSHTLDGIFVGSIAFRRYILSGLSNSIKVPNRTKRSELSPILAISSGISQGIIDEHFDVRKACESVAEVLNSKGPINVQCRYVNKELYVFEINPRFSGTTFMRAMVGFNEPDILIRHHLLGESLPERINYKYGRIVRGLAERYVMIPSPIKPWSENGGS